MIPTLLRRLRLRLADAIRPSDPSPLPPRGTPPPEIYRLELGDNYTDYWNNMAHDRDSAYFGVAGKPFGATATEQSLEAHGAQTAPIIIRKLDIGPEDRVLEIGVGVARLARHIAPRCRHFTGVDISARMVGYAAERLAEFPNVHLAALDHSGLDRFPAHAFDKVYSQVVLIHLDREDVFRYLCESFRVLRPGGRAFFQFYNLLHPGGFAEFRHAVEFMQAKGGKLRGRVQAVTPDEVRKYLGEAGFRVREDLSHLEPVEQRFDFELPDKDWEFYLIAVAEKP